MPVSELKTLAPDFPWDAFLAESHIPLTTTTGSERYAIVAEKTAFGPLAKIFAATPVSTWRDYLVVHYLQRFAAYLPKRFDDRNFAFYGTVLAGNTQQLDRRTRGIHLLDRTLGEALGKSYVARYFPPASKAKAEQLVSNLLKAYEADIQTLDWMSPATRAKAAGEDLGNSRPRSRSYPDHWRDYSAYEVHADDASSAISSVPPCVRLESRRQSHQPARRQDRMGHVAAYHQCLLQSVLQRDRVPCRCHFAGAVLRSQC